MAVNFPFLFGVPRRAQIGAGIGRAPQAGHAAAGILALAVLGACAAPPAQGINDPAEGFNRGIHSFNKGLDRAAFRPASQVYGHVLPQPVRTGVSNFSNNLELVGDVANNILQGRPKTALDNSMRFLFNTTFGLAGFLDPASEAGLPHHKTDFGETLHVWGFGEGPYMELPVFGPSTARDTVGFAVDIAMNPLNGLTDHEPERYTPLAAQIGSKLGDRYRYSRTVDSVLYESADSYAQARLLYLQNRRYELGQSESAGGDFIDPYDDDGGAGGTSSVDPSFIDPYEE